MHGGQRRRWRQQNEDDSSGREEDEKKKKRGRLSARGAMHGCGYSILEVSRGRREEAAVEKENKSNENDGTRGGGSNAPLRLVLLGYYQLFLLASSLFL
jgi:hypothetical protein